MRLLAVLLLVIQAAPAAPPAAAARPLFPGGSIRDSLAGGERAAFSFDVPAGSAARVRLTQEGIDLGLTLRRQGSSLPEHGLDMTAGVAGDEEAYPPVEDAPASWTVLVTTSLPHAVRGDYTISLEIAPADAAARARASARAEYQRASDTAWGGDAKAFRESLPEYAKAAEDARACGDVPLEAEATYQSARVSDSLGQPLAAIEKQTRALALFRAIGRRDREGRVLDRLGDLSRKTGEVVAAEGYFTDALPLARASADAEAIVDIQNNSGLLMLTMGRYEEAVERLQAAIPLARQIGSANVEAALSSNSALAYGELGLGQKSVDWYERGLAVVERMNIPRRTAHTLINLARAYYRNGEAGKADGAMARALALYATSGDGEGTAEALAQSGQMRQASGDDERAAELFARAQPALHAAHNRVQESAVLSAWAEIAIDRGDADAALSKAGAALDLARLIADPDAVERALYVRALALDRAGRIDEAVASIAEAVQHIEDTRGAIARSELRRSFLARVRRYFDLYIDLLQRRGRAAEAFEVSERAKARTLLEGLAESASKISKGVDPGLLARERSVGAALNAKELYRARLALEGGGKSPAAAAVDRDVDRLLEEWSGLRAAIRAASPAYSALEMPGPVRVADVQRTLVGADSVLVEYHLGGTRSYVWIVGRRSLVARELARPARIDAVARRFHELLSQDADALRAPARATLAADIASTGARLAALVWTPIAPRVAGKRLLIVADGLLQYVPFAALPDANGEPLIAGHEIVYLPSASVLQTLRRRSRVIRPDAPTAVFADPVFSKNDPRLGGARDGRAPSVTRAANGGTYGRLRFSRAEADAIKAVSRGAFEALDFDASKGTVERRDLRRYRILHFATHGSLDTEHPELSGLVFSLVDRRGEPVDGFLRLHEIYNLDLDADLVVLSACETALGKEVYGEGLIGLTRGFMYAGASRVVSSVWSVDDRASARLMTAFYTAMLEHGLSPASALRQAQRSLLRDPRWANPHYWAAFGLYGEWR